MAVETLQVLTEWMERMYYQTRNRE